MEQFAALGIRLTPPNEAAPGCATLVNDDGEYILTPLRRGNELLSDSAVVWPTDDDDVVVRRFKSAGAGALLVAYLNGVSENGTKVLLTHLLRFAPDVVGRSATWFLLVDLASRAYVGAVEVLLNDKGEFVPERLGTLLDAAQTHWRNVPGIVFIGKSVGTAFVSHAALQEYADLQQNGLADACIRILALPT